MTLCSTYTHTHTQLPQVRLSLCFSLLFLFSVASRTPRKEIAFTSRIAYYYCIFYYLNIGAYTHTQADINQLYICRRLLDEFFLLHTMYVSIVIVAHTPQQAANISDHWLNDDCRLNSLIAVLLDEHQHRYIKLTVIIDSELAKSCLNKWRDAFTKPMGAPNTRPRYTNTCSCKMSSRTVYRITTSQTAACARLIYHSSRYARSSFPWEYLRNGMPESVCECLHNTPVTTKVYPVSSWPANGRWDMRASSCPIAWWYVIDGSVIIQSVELPAHSR